MTRTPRPRALLAAVLLAATACPSHSKPPALEGAITDIPVYAPAALTKKLDHPYNGPACQLHSLIWELETPDEWSKVQYFYRQKLSFVTPELDAGVSQGPTRYSYAPAGGDAKRQERVLVTIGPKEASGTKFRIEETVCASRRGGG